MAANNILGELKSSGIFLKENGEVGNISQIDFAAQGKKAQNKNVDKQKEQPLATLSEA